MEQLKSRWTPTNQGVEEILDRVVGWADAELRLHLLGWLATRTDDQILEDVEMVGALENMAYTRTITKMGEDIMTDVVELCTMLMTNGQVRGDDYQQHPSSSQLGEERPEEEKAVPTACMQGCPDLYPGHHKVG